jgi:hypothetical protein
MKPVDAEENPGLAKLPTEVRNKMGYMKKGGLTKSLKEAGFYEADKNDRLDIIDKVTTKPQRVAMVDKMLLTKKMASGGSASKRADGCAIRGKTKA